MSESSRRLLPSVPRLTITLMIALTLSVPAAYVLMPHVHRWRTLSQLTSDDAAARERALHYVIRHAAQRPRVREGAIRALSEADEAGFLQIVAALEHAGVWGRQWVPDEAWVRWLTLVAQSDDAESQAFVAHRLGDLTKLADDPRVVGTLERLLESDEPDARYNAMISAASLLSHGGDAGTYEAMIGSRAADAEPAIARHAWILLGHLDPVFGYGGNWRTAPPPVAEAILWASVKTNPQQPMPAIEAVGDFDAAPAVRAAAAYALSQSETEAAMDALLKAADVPAGAVTADDQRRIWRAILGLPRPDLQRDPYSRLERVVVGFAMDDGDDPLVEPLALASVYRMGVAGARRQTQDPREYDLLLKLATVEGQEPPYMRWPLTGDKPPLLRAMTVAVDSKPHIGDLRPALASSLATLRDLAAVIAAERFDDETIGGMVESLLLDYNDDAKMGGAILAGLANVKGKLLRQRAEAEDVWAVQQVMRLGLWMQGETMGQDGSGEDWPGMERVAEAVGAQGASMSPWPGVLLTREGVSPTTVLLAMLHRGKRVEALDALLSPRAEPPMKLVELFGELRWWHVLRRYLPADAPPLWLWGDPQLQQFQVDVLRDWWLLERGGARRSAVE